MNSVTVITPTYNCANFIRQTAASVVAQDYPNLRYIILDDGSTDETQQKLRDYKRISGVSVLSHANMGEHKTINKGLQMVETKYFIILNSDDLLLPESVYVLVNFMEAHPKVLCAYPDIATLNEDGSYRTRYLPRPEYDFKHMVRYHNCLPSVGAIFRSSVIKQVGLRDVSFRWVADFDYWLRIGLAGDMCRVPKVLAAWRHRAGQATKANSDLQATDRERLINKFYSLDIPPEIKAVRNEAYSWTYLIAAYLATSKTLKARYAAKALAVYPQQVVKPQFFNALGKYVMRSRLRIE